MTDETHVPEKPSEFEIKATEYTNICAQLGEKEHLIRNAKGQCDAWHDQLNTLQKKLKVLKEAEKALAAKKEALNSKSPVPTEAPVPAAPAPEASAS